MTDFQLAKAIWDEWGRMTTNRGHWHLSAERGFWVLLGTVTAIGACVDGHGVSTDELWEETCHDPGTFGMKLIMPTAILRYSRRPFTVEVTNGAMLETPSLRDGSIEASVRLNDRTFDLFAELTDLDIGMDQSSMELENCLLLWNWREG